MINLCMDSRLDEERMLVYKELAAAFMYPDDKFFKIFPKMSLKKIEIKREYDRLFRAKEIWLYGAEYTIKTEFQRANYLADIMGFYQAFGLDRDKDRPDLLPSELEFMYYLIFKKCYAVRNKKVKDGKRKAAICIDAQKKFFREHLYPAAKNIAEKIINNSKKNFYTDMADQMLKFIRSEKELLDH